MDFKISPCYNYAWFKKVIYIKVHISVVYPPIKHNLLFLSGIKSRRIFTHSQLLYIVWLCIGM
jgi:hypothetical protein